MNKEAWCGAFIVESDPKKRKQGEALEQDRLYFTSIRHKYTSQVYVTSIRHKYTCGQQKVVYLQTLTINLLNLLNLLMP